MIEHIKNWNEWRKSCGNSRWHKLLVLFGLTSSTSFDIFLTEKVRQEMAENISGWNKMDNSDDIILKAVTDFRYANPECYVTWVTDDIKDCVTLVVHNQRHISTVAVSKSDTYGTSFTLVDVVRTALNNAKMELENPADIILKVVTDFRYANPEYNVEWKKIRNEIIGRDELTFDINTYGQSYVRRIPAYYPSKIALGDAVRAVLIDVKAAEESWLIFKEGLQMGTETLDRGSFDGYVKEALTRAIDALPADYNKEDGHETK